MQFNKLEPLNKTVELTQAEWEEARRATLAEMVEVFGEEAVARFVKSVGTAPPAFIVVKDVPAE